MSYPAAAAITLPTPWVGARVSDAVFRRAEVGGPRGLVRTLACPRPGTDQVRTLACPCPGTDRREPCPVLWGLPKVCAIKRPLPDRRGLPQDPGLRPSLEAVPYPPRVTGLAYARPPFCLMFTVPPRRGLH